MSRYIDADRFKDILERASEKMHLICGIKGVDIGAIIKGVDMFPTADVVEVVRCRDCRYWDRENIEMHTRCTGDDTLVEFAECFKWSNWSVCRWLRFDDYCSCGERRANDGEKDN